MNKKVRWITETAVMLALLIALQAVTKPFGQFVTGSCVNAVLCITVLIVGLYGGITVALISPIFAFISTIAPNLITVVPIMLGNLTYVLLIHFLWGKTNKFSWQQPVAVVSASVAKFVVLYVLVVKVICGVASGAFMGKMIGDRPLLAPKMLQTLPAMFGWPQLVTALIGGTIGFLIVPILHKATKK